MPNQSENGVKIITVASGKSGVGKTNISLNLALALLDYLPKVSLLDADLGLANISISLQDLVAAFVGSLVFLGLLGLGRRWNRK